MKNKIKNKNTIFSYMKGGRALLLFALFFALLATFFNFLIPQIIGFTVDCVFNDEQYPDILLQFNLPDRAWFLGNLYAIAIVLVCVSLLYGTSAFFQRFTTQKTGEIISANMKNKLFSHIQRLPYAWHQSIQTGDIIQRATSDVDVIKRFVSEQFIELVQTMIMAVGGLIVMFLMNLYVGILTAVFMPILVVFSFFYFKKSGTRFRDADEAEGGVSATLQENLTGVRIVRAHGMQRFETDKFEAKTNDLAEKWKKLSITMGAFWSLSDFISAMQVVGILTLGAVLVANGDVTKGQFLMFLFYNQILIWPIRNLGRILGELSKARISISRINEISDAEAEHDDPKTSLCPEISGSIEFQNVSFCYPDSPETKILDDISFSIESGKTLGIVGSTGSGKSSVVHLINRLYDVSGGAILIDGIDISKINRQHLRKNVGLILQESFLFSRTIKDNINISNPLLGLEEVKKYAAIAHIDKSIEEFAEKYDTFVGERGVTLSGGQKQRVAIARTLITKPPILVFDDSLSAVDTDTDLAIRQALNQNLNCTTIIISHRITSVMKADKIVVLDGGKIVEQGSHKQLISQNGIYKQIFDLQVLTGQTLEKEAEA